MCCSVPSAKTWDDITYYKVVCRNKKLKWQFYVRFDYFRSLHNEMKEVIHVTHPFMRWC